MSSPSSIYVLECDSSVSQHTFFARCLSIRVRIESRLLLHDMRPQLARLFRAWARGLVEVQSLVRAPRRVFEVCSTAEQGNKPSFSKVNWAMDPTALFHTLLFSLCSLFPRCTFYLSPSIIFSPFQPFCSHPLTAGAEWCSLLSPLDQYWWLSASCEPASCLVLTGSLCCCVGSREHSSASALLGG